MHSKRTRDEWPISDKPTGIAPNSGTVPDVGHPSNKTPMYDLNEKHMSSVLAMPGPERYSYVIKKVADFRCIYALESPSGWALAGDDASFNILPIWPHPRFAELCIKDGWSDCVVAPIPMDEWLNKMSPMLEKKQTKIAVFQLPEGKGVVVEPERLSADIREELAKVEDA
jgi:Protein of unknown function (DUF2750)